jgi:nicotinamide riboside transporter PnuC
MWEPRWLGRARIAVALVALSLACYVAFVSAGRALELGLAGTCFVLVVVAVVGMVYRDRWNNHVGRE